MGKINYGRVLIGGLLAGVIISVGEAVLNLLVVGDQWTAYVAQHNLPADSAAMNVMWLVWNFVAGIVLVLLYALVRPRCGAGPKTAVWTGVLFWFIVWPLCFAAIGIAFAMPSDMILISLAWGLVEVVIASLAGASTYKEA